MGFSLFEFIIYIALLLLIGVSFFHGCYYCLNHFRLQADHCAMIIAQESALDLLAHDLLSAPNLACEWKKIDRSELIWHYNSPDNLQDYDIGWTITNGILCRIHGKYNEQRSFWRKKRKNPVAKHIQHFAFTINYTTDERSIENITVSVIQNSPYEKTYCSERIIALRTNLLESAEND